MDERRRSLLRAIVLPAVLGGCSFDASGLGGPPSLGDGSSTAEATTEMPPPSTGLDSSSTGTPTSTDSGVPVTSEGTTTGDVTTASEGTTTGDGSDSTTGMAGCSDDGDCPPGWVCEAPECINPDEGEMCLSATDCGPAAPFCTYDTQCHDGSDGDPCNGDGQCDAPIVCGPTSTCQDGNEGDSCGGAADCGPAAPYCPYDAQCHDGSEGDPCSGDNQCDAPLVCGATIVCQDGSEGDPCSGAADCGAAAPFCPFDMMCHDGSEGDPCSGDNQCDAPLVCGPTGVCQDGSEGDPCSGAADCSAAAPYCPYDAHCHDGTLGDPCNDDAQCSGVLGCVLGVNTCGF